MSAVLLSYLNPLSMNYYLIDDQGAKLGGAEMTLEAIAEAGRTLGHSVVTVPTKGVHSLITDDPPYFIFGNICDLKDRQDGEAILDIIRKGRFSKIEFDYGYIPYRGTIPYQAFTGHSYAPERHRDTQMHILYEEIRKHAEHLFFMSRAQRKIHSAHFNDGRDKDMVLSSCFTDDNLNLMREIREKDNERSPSWIVLEGRDKWQQWCKGTHVAMQYLESQGITHKVVRTSTHRELLELFGSHAGHMLMPNIHDTCPRTAIEATLCGAELAYNTNVQHMGEAWTQGTVEETEEYIRQAPFRFWEQIAC